MTDMLQVLCFDVYAYLYLGSTLAFVTPLVSRKFDILPDILNEPLVVTTSVGELVVAKRVSRIVL